MAVCPSDGYIVLWSSLCVGATQDAPLPVRTDLRWASLQLRILSCASDDDRS